MNLRDGFHPSYFGWVSVMSNYNQIVVVIILSLLLLGLPFETANNQLSTMKEAKAIPAAIDIIQVITDPYLESEQDGYVNGTSGEFQYSYGDDVMELNWTHTQGVELDFSSDDDSETPCYNDFVYFTQSFDWPYEEMPEDAEMYLNYSVSLAGGFIDNSSTLTMMKVYAWFIDSSNDWERLYSAYPYDSSFQERLAPLNYWQLLEGFRGMIEDESGVQDDPEDTLRLGIGLAPTDDFQSSLANGSILIEVTSVTLQVIMEAIPNPATHLTPLYNKTFASLTSDLIPGPIGSNPEIWDHLRHMTKDPDGNLYLTGDCMTGYEFYVEEGQRGLSQFLVKYNPTLNRKWVIRNDNMTRGRAITYHDGSIFTSGMKEHTDLEHWNLLLTKWSTSGQKVWEKEWGGDYDQVGVAIDVSNDSSIYVVVSDFNIRTEDVYHNSTLLKFDSAGNVLWNKPIDLITIQDASAELWVFEDKMLYHLGSSITCMDLEGNWLWSKVSGAATCDENGNIFSAERTGEGVAIRQYDLDGNQTWVTYHQIEYPNEWIEDLSASDITLTPTGELLVLVLGNRYDHTYFLLKYSLEGDHIQTWSIGDYAWPRPGSWPPHMEVTSTGLVYFAFVPMTSDVWTQAYVIGDYTLPPEESLYILQITAVGGGIAVIALIGIYVYKRKRV